MNRGLRPLVPREPALSPHRPASHQREKIRTGWVNFRSSDGSVFDCRSQRLNDAHAAISPKEAEPLVLDILHCELRGEVERRVAAHRAQVVAALDNFWSKYRVNLREIEEKREATAGALDNFLCELGYAR